MAGLRWTLGAAALSLASCATSGSFDPDVGPRIHYAIGTSRPDTMERVAVDAIPVSAGAPAPYDPWIAEFVTLRSPRTTPRDDAWGAGIVDSGPATFDPRLLPLPRLSLDFELGVACDEPDEDLHNSDVHEVSGISETLLRISCSYGLTPSASLVGTMAASQILDETLQATVEDSELIWFAIGVRFQF